MTDDVQPRFDELTYLQTNMSQSRPGIVGGLDRISSGLEFIRSSLARLDQPVSLGGDPFIELNNTEAVTTERYNSLGLDFMLPASGPPFRYN